ncbi:hypothetical protein ABPG77_005602 [Micractinium sp. CCAP 211/92]
MSRGRPLTTQELPIAAAPYTVAVPTSVFGNSQACGGCLSVQCISITDGSSVAPCGTSAAPVTLLATDERPDAADGLDIGTFDTFAEIAGLSTYDAGRVQYLTLSWTWVACPPQLLDASGGIWMQAVSGSSQYYQRYSFSSYKLRLVSVLQNGVPLARQLDSTWVSNAVLTPGSLVTFILTAADGQSVKAVVADPWTANRSLGVNFS